MWTVLNVNLVHLSYFTSISVVSVMNEISTQFCKLEMSLSGNMTNPMKEIISLVYRGPFNIYTHDIKSVPSLLFCELDKESETRKFLKYFLKMSKHQGEKNPNLLICASF